MYVAAQFIHTIRKPVVLVTWSVLMGLSVVVLCFVAPAYVLYGPLVISGLILLRALHTLWILAAASFREGWDIARLQLTVEMQGIQAQEMAEEQERKRRVQANLAKLRGEEPPEQVQEEPKDRHGLRVIDGGRKAS